MGVTTRGMKDFNPRSRKGSDVDISVSYDNATDFNPRSRKGSDGNHFFVIIIYSIFQSTLPQRERRVYFIFPNSLKRFQSTLPQRERLRWSVKSKIFCVRFQSTLPQRERQALPLLPPALSCYFNPRSRKGSDPKYCLLVINQYAFQSTLPQRERRMEGDRVEYMGVFQSTLPQRERHNKRLIISLCRHYFNPRSRKGSDTFSSGIMLPPKRFQSTLPQRERLKRI